MPICLHPDPNDLWPCEACRAYDLTYEDPEDQRTLLNIITAERRQAAREEARRKDALRHQYQQRQRQAESDRFLALSIEREENEHYARDVAGTDMNQDEIYSIIHLQPSWNRGESLADRERVQRMRFADNVSHRPGYARFGVMIRREARGRNEEEERRRRQERQDWEIAMGGQNDQWGQRV